MTRFRRAGSRWRLLVHDMVANGENGISRHFRSHEHTPRKLSDPEKQKRLEDIAREWSRTTVVSDTEFDELVVGQAFHIEQMDTGTYWMNIGGVTVWLRMDRDGKPTRVDVYGPSNYDRPIDGCEYSVSWSEPTS